MNTISASNTSMRYVDPFQGFDKSLQNIQSNIDKKEQYRRDRAGAEALQYANMDAKQREAFLQSRKQAEIDNMVNAETSKAKNWYNPADWFRTNKEAYIAENTDHSPENGVAIKGSGESKYNTLLNNTTEGYNSKYSTDAAVTGPTLDNKTGAYTGAVKNDEAARLEANYLNSLGLTSDQMMAYNNTVNKRKQGKKSDLLFTQGQQDRVTRLNEKELTKQHDLDMAKNLATTLGIKYDPNTMQNANDVNSIYSAGNTTKQKKVVQLFAKQNNLPYTDGMTMSQATGMLNAKYKKTEMGWKSQDYALKRRKYNNDIKIANQKAQVNSMVMNAINGTDDSTTNTVTPSNGGSDIDKLNSKYQRLSKILPNLTGSDATKVKASMTQTKNEILSKVKVNKKYNNEIDSVYKENAKKFANDPTKMKSLEQWYSDAKEQGKTTQGWNANYTRLDKELSAVMPDPKDRKTYIESMIGKGVVTPTKQQVDNVLSGDTNKYKTDLKHYETKYKKTRQKLVDAGKMTQSIRINGKIDPALQEKNAVDNIRTISKLATGNDNNIGMVNNWSHNQYGETYSTTTKHTTDSSLAGILSSKVKVKQNGKMMTVPIRNIIGMMDKNAAIGFYDLLNSGRDTVNIAGNREISLEATDPATGDRIESSMVKYLQNVVDVANTDNSTELKKLDDDYKEYVRTATQKYNTKRSKVSSPKTNRGSVYGSVVNQLRNPKYGGVFVDTLKTKYGIQ